MQPPGFLDFPNGRRSRWKRRILWSCSTLLRCGMRPALDAALNVKARENGDRRQAAFATYQVHLPRRCREALDG
jgi:hypothetical protein